MADLLVISHAFVTAINRRPYRELAKLGWDVELVTLARVTAADIDRAADPAAPDDPPLHLLGARGSNYRLWTFEGLTELLDARRPRIVLLDYEPGSRIAIQVGRWCRRHGAHLVCFSYDNFVRPVLAELRRSPAAGVRAAIVEGLSWASRATVDRVFVLSSHGEAALRHLGYGDRLTRIPLGFDPALFHPKPDARARVRRELGLRELTFAYFGRVIPEKGVHLLIQALHELRDRRWQLLLDKFSDFRHPYIREIHDLIDRLALGDRVVYFDASHDEVADYMNAADVVVMPSVTTERFKEQYGRVAPEAMACGRLVVSSDGGALPELVGDAGIVVPERELPRLHQTLGRILDDPTVVDRYSARAAERAREHLSLPVQVRMMESVFRQWTAASRIAVR